MSPLVPGRTVLRDLRAGSRSALRHPREALACVAVLALGIGVATALFAVLDGVVLRGLPVPDGERIGSVSTSRGHDSPTPVDDVFALRERQALFEDVSGLITLNSVLTRERQGSRSASATYVTGNLFSMLGIAPMVGRAVLPEDTEPGAPQVVVLSHRLWQSEFAARLDVLGERVEINRESATVVGVMPEGFQFPVRQDVWAAFRRDDMPWSTDTLFVIGKLREGSGARAAELALAPLLRQLDEEHPLDVERRAFVTPYTRAVLSPQLQRALRLMVFAGVALLVVACANTASLRLARALEREHDTAVRRALGASRLDLLRQHCAEAAVWVNAAGALGVAIAWSLARLAEAHLLRGSMLVRQYWIDVRLDARSVAFAAVAIVVVFLLGGVLPALAISRAGGLAAGARSTTRPVALGALRGLVAVEVAVAFALLVATTVLVDRAVSLLAPRLGFDPAGLSRTLVTSYQARFEEGEAERFWTGVLESLLGRPEIAGAALASGVPWTQGGSAVVRTAGARDVAFEALPRVAVDRVSPGTIELLRLQLLAGRSLDADDARVPEPREPSAVPREQPVLVSASFARRHLEGSPLGQSLELWWGDRERLVRGRVVGVVADLGLGAPAEGPDVEEHLYLPSAPAGGLLLVRARVPDADVRRVIDDEIRRANPLVATLDHRTYEEDRDESTWVERRLAQLFVTFGSMTVTLGAVGLYGVLALFARRRERELGIRAAIGASPRALASIVLREGGRTVALGLALGAAVSYALDVPLGAVIPGVTVLEPGALVLAAALVSVSAALASLRPARRVARVDPVDVLRGD